MRWWIYYDWSLDGKLLPFFVATSLLWGLGIWKARKEEEPNRAGVTQLKYLTIGLAVFLYGLILNLHVGIYKYMRPGDMTSFEHVYERQKEMAADVENTVEIFEYFLLMMIFWVVLVYLTVSAMVRRARKN